MTKVAHNPFAAIAYMHSLYSPTLLDKIPISPLPHVLPFTMSNRTNMVTSRMKVDWAMLTFLKV